MTDPNPEALAAVLDTMLPGDDVFPSASAVDLAAEMIEHPVFAIPTQAALALLPEGLHAADAAARIAAIAALEAHHPAVFAPFITAVYSVYYAAAPTLRAVEAATGYAARPPQPEGYALKPFDPALLAVPAARAPHYRTIPERS